MNSQNYTPRAIEVLEEVATLMKRKNEDYTSDIVSDPDYFGDWEQAPNITLMMTKLLRYRATYGNTHNFDDAKACLTDLIAYAARAIVHIELEEADQYLPDPNDYQLDDREEQELSYRLVSQDD